MPSISKRRNLLLDFSAGAAPAPAATEAGALQIFLCPGVDALKRFFDVFD